MAVTDYLLLSPGGEPLLSPGGQELLTVGAVREILGTVDGPAPDQSTIRAYRHDTGALLGGASPAADGSYRVAVGQYAGEIFVAHVPTASDEYPRPIHHHVTPDW
jgi:hypothetical protein